MSFYFFIVKDKPHYICDTASQGKYSKYAVWLIFGLVCCHTGKEEEEQRDGKKEKGQWTARDVKITCSSNITFRQKNSGL